MKNTCLDTNTIIAYLFISEPQHSIIKKYLDKHPTSKYYFTEHILEESEDIFDYKQNIIRSILADFTDFLIEYHNRVISSDIINKYIQNRVNITINEGINDLTIKKILFAYWQLSIEGYVEGLQACRIFDKYIIILLDIIHYNKDIF